VEAVETMEAEVTAVATVEATEEEAMAVVTVSSQTHGADDEESTWKKGRGKEERKKAPSSVAEATTGVERATRRYNAAADPSDRKWRSS